MYNKDLEFDLEKLKDFDPPITVVKTFDDNLDFPCVIDVEDNSYFYIREQYRDNDFNLLREAIPKFSYYNK